MEDDTSGRTSAQQAVIAINKLNETISEFNNSIIPAARMPGLTGDVTSTAGTVATTIAANAVTTAKILAANVTQAKLATGVAGTGPMFYASRATNQSINNATFTKLQVSTENYDTASCYDNATNYRFTPNVAGHYLIIGKQNIADYTNGNNVVSIYKDNSIYVSGSQGYLYGSQVSAIIYMDGVTNYVELYGYQSTGGAANIASSYFWGCLVRAA